MILAEAEAVAVAAAVVEGDQQTEIQNRRGENLEEGGKDGVG